MIRQEFSSEFLFNLHQSAEYVTICNMAIVYLHNGITNINDVIDINDITNLKGTSTSMMF